MSPSNDERRYRDGGGWEVAAGYSRAARRGDVIVVSGTTATDEVASAHPDDTARQAGDAIARALAAVQQLGGTVDDVVRSRVFLAPGADWQAASDVHAELLGAVAPANTTLYVHALIGPSFLVEVELDAVLGAAEAATVDQEATG